MSDEGSSQFQDESIASDASGCQRGECQDDAMIQRTLSKDREALDIPTISVGSTMGGANGAGVASGNPWAGQEWWGGGQCYNDDDNIHSFKVGITTDFEADKVHGSNLQGLIQTIMVESSLVYEKQFNIRLEVSDLEMFADGAPNAPTVMKSCYSDTSNSPGGTEGTPKLFDFTKLLGDDPNTFQDTAAWHLLSGCGLQVISLHVGCAGSHPWRSSCTSSTNSSWVFQLLQQVKPTQQSLVRSKPHRS